MDFLTTQTYVVIQSKVLWQMLLKKQLAPKRDSGIYSCKDIFLLMQQQQYEKKTKII